MPNPAAMSMAANFPTRLPGPLPTLGTELSVAEPEALREVVGRDSLVGASAVVVVGAAADVEPPGVPDAEPAVFSLNSPVAAAVIAAAAMSTTTRPAMTRALVRPARRGGCGAVAAGAGGGGTGAAAMRCPSAATGGGSQPSPSCSRVSVEAARHSSITPAGLGRAAGFLSRQRKATPHTDSG